MQCLPEWRPPSVIHILKIADKLVENVSECEKQSDKGDYFNLPNLSNHIQPPHFNPSLIPYLRQDFVIGANDEPENCFTPEQIPRRS